MAFHVANVRSRAVSQFLWIAFRHTAIFCMQVPIDLGWRSTTETDIDVPRVWPWGRALRTCNASVERARLGGRRRRSSHIVYTHASVSFLPSSCSRHIGSCASRIQSSGRSTGVTRIHAFSSQKGRPLTISSRLHPESHVSGLRDCSFSFLLLMGSAFFRWMLHSAIVAFCYRCG